MAIDITPETDRDTEVSLGDEVQLKWTQDAQLASDTDLTLTIPASCLDASDDLEVDATQMREVDHGDGTFTYIYDHVLQALTTPGRWHLTGPQGEAADRFVLNANP